MKGGVYRMLTTNPKIFFIVFSFLIWFIIYFLLLLFGVKHQFVARFQMHFHRAEFLGEVLAAALHQPPCQVHSDLLSRTLRKRYACPQPAADVREGFLCRFLFQ